MQAVIPLHAGDEGRLLNKNTPRVNSSRGREGDYGQPLRKGKKTHQRKVASTQKKNNPHMHRNRIAPTPMAIPSGLMVLFSMYSVVVTGLAGTLPA